ncbi:hypothetical protein G4B88_018899 [Cannabis sativa]|uniref:CCHC-type domain-containing protein n=1 Tax=Cannabis sativa TaxID=3483 RepID=A0A7J6H068_CANSA|nr:hypothetical protein G4B88_018899 [Cannabis sativa]
MTPLVESAYFIYPLVSMGEKGKEIQVEFVDTEKDELLSRDSALEMEMLELFEDITLEDVVVSKACVGKVVGCKDMPASVVKKILAGVWRKLGFWRMKKCDDGVLGFFFEEEEDYLFVMEKRPWIINGVLLNLKPWPIEGEVSVGEFDVALFWVQFHGLPTRFLSNENVPILAKKVGNLVKMEERRKEDIVRRGYLRCWIDVWMAHPFPSGFFLKADGKPDSWVQFKYEKLPHLCFNCGKLAHWDKVCSVQPTMVIPTEGPAVPMYGTWIKSDTGRSNCFNMKGKGSIRSLVVREEVPEWDVGKPYRRRTWKRNQRSEEIKITTASSSSEGQVLGTVTVAGKDNDVGQKRKFVQEGTPTTTNSNLQRTDGSCEKVTDGSVLGNVSGVQNVENMENVQLDLNEVGPNFLDLPTPDFSFGPEGSELIPDIGPSIAQSLDIPHSWLCRSQTPHEFPEPTHIKWPNDDLEAQKMFFSALWAGCY